VAAVGEVGVGSRFGAVGKTRAIADLTAVTNPAWELCGHLIPLVAVEQLADAGERAVAEALLAAYAEPTGTDDLAHAAQCRLAVATAAVGRFSDARAAVERLTADYRDVGSRARAASCRRRASGRGG
jgi:hypothetical protein